MKAGTKLSQRLGEMLLEAKILNEDGLNHAIELSSETGLPLGRVLVMCGYIGDRELEAAVKAQALVKDGALTLSKKAQEALTILGAEGADFDVCLKQVGWVNPDRPPTARLGELLQDSDMIARPQLEDALKTSQETGLPLGRVLVLTNAVSEEMLSAALTAQVLVRDNKISREQAVQALKSSRFRRVNIEVSLIDLGFYKPPPRQRVRLAGRAACLVRPG